VPPYELADGALRFVDQLPHYRDETAPPGGTLQLEELANALLDHSESGMAAGIVASIFTLALCPHSSVLLLVLLTRRRLVWPGQWDWSCGLFTRRVAAERHNDDWALKSLVFSKHTFDRIMQQAPHDLLKTYFEVLPDVCAVAQLVLLSLSLSLLTV
jgi:hypothetical protein